MKPRLLIQYHIQWANGGGVQVRQDAMEIPDEYLHVERKIDWRDASDEELIAELQRRLNAIPF